MAAACCAALASASQLPRSEAAQVAAAAAVNLGSGRRALQALARTSDSALNIRNSAADLLDSMQMFTRLLNHGDFVTFATSVAPPQRLLGWLQDAAAVLNRLGSLPRAGGQGRGVCWGKGGHCGYRQHR